MWYDIAPLEELVEAFRRLPGIGGKSARRLAYYLISLPREQTEKFAQTVLHAADSVKRCRVCHNLSDTDLCPVCRDEKRDRSVVCVVQSPQDMIAVEKTGEYNGLYHILNGVLSPTNDVKPSDLTIKDLITRLGTGEIKEVILATGSTAEGEVTAVYIANLLKPLALKVTRLAYGMPVGGELEFADEMTLLRALEGRAEL